MQKIYQSGFSMFEIAFVIVIISLLATIMMIGKNLAINTQVSRLEHDFHSIQTAIYDSQNGSRSMHGNVRKASLQLQDSAAVGDNSNWNAIVEGKWSSTSGETFGLWMNLRPAGFAQGSTNKIPNSYVPLKPSSSEDGVPENYSALITGLKGDYIICTHNVAGRLAKELDLIMDDGITASGNMMVSNSIGGAAIATDRIINSSAYVVCLGV
jgi:type II secretory pathway pseudopilin PulG